jgi:hypothetical protein
VRPEPPISSRRERRRRACATVKRHRGERRYTGKKTVKRRRGGRDNSGARITQTNLTTNPTHQRNHTHDRATTSNPRPINQHTISRSPGRADRTSPPIAPRGPDSEEAASLPLATAQRATTPPGGLSGSFSEGLVPVGSASPIAVARAPPRSLHEMRRLA